MLLAERGSVLDGIGCRGNAFTNEFGESGLEIQHVSVEDGIEQQVQPLAPSADHGILPSLLVRSAVAILRSSAFCRY